MYMCEILCHQVSRDMSILLSADAANAAPCSHVNQKIMWSQPVSINSVNDCCVTIPLMSDVKVHLERISHTTHLYIDAISRAEISAKEVRSRIRGEETVKVISTSSSVVTESKHRRQKSEGQITAVPSPSSDDKSRPPSLDKDENNQTVPKAPAATSPNEQQEVELQATAVLKAVSLVLIKEEASPQQTVCYRECLRLSLTDVIAILYPHPKNIAQLTAYRKHVTYGVSLQLGGLQLDNQMQRHGQYDFPVIVWHPPPPRGDVTRHVDQSFVTLLLAERLAVMRHAGFLAVEMALCKDLHSGAATLQDVAVRVTPLQLFFEDTFVYDALKIVDGLFPMTLSDIAAAADCVTPATERRLPANVKVALSEYARPIRLQRLSIEALSLDLSVHASLKLFIASDHSPLVFAAFERTDVFSSPAQFARAVAMHYASGAIFRAGWVVGSLELLGNPTGLVRSVGAGVADLFRLPYAGLARGPGAFLAGASSGMTSFVRNVSSGV